MRAAVTKALSLYNMQTFTYISHIYRLVRSAVHTVFTHI